MKLSEDQIAEYNERGYLLFPSLFSSEEVTVMLRAVPELMSRTGPEVITEEEDEGAVRMVFGAHVYNETFRRLSRHSRVLLPTERLLESHVHAFQTRLTPKKGFAGNGWSWHQDFNQWNRHDGMKHPRGLLVGVFLDDVNVSNAPIMVIPGSHKRGHIPIPDIMDIDHPTIEELANQGGIEALMGPAGSVAFINCLTVHGSTPNISPWSRRIFYINYNSVENQEVEQRRAWFYCSIDFTPLEPLDDNCLIELDGGENA